MESLGAASMGLVVLPVGPLGSDGSGGSEAAGCPIATGAIVEDLIMDDCSIGEIS